MARQSTGFQPSHELLDIIGDSQYHFKKHCTAHSKGKVSYSGNQGQTTNTRRKLGEAASDEKYDLDNPEEELPEHITPEYDPIDPEHSMPEADEWDSDAYD
jgi:hypothetical protein